MSARFFILLMMALNIIYNAVLSHFINIQRQKPLPASVSDVYDAERYQKFLSYKAEYRKLGYIFLVLNLLVEIPLLLSGIYPVIQHICVENPYRIALLTFVVFFIPSTLLDIIQSWISTFRIEEKYVMNKKTNREFIKDLCISLILDFAVTVALTLFLVFVCEHMESWTDHFSISWAGSFKISLIIAAVLFVFFALLQGIAYLALRLQYKFTPMEEGPLLDKIRDLQRDSKKKVKSVFIYNESKKTTTKNAFLLKLFWHREFGIADNFMNENEERELLAVLSHEIGHLKHKKNWQNYLSYGMPVIMFILLVCLIHQPAPIFFLSKWVMDSFDMTVVNYTIIITVLGQVIGPLGILLGLFNNSRSRSEEYEADREAVKNGYGRELIKTFKRLSNDELVDVNPHPLIETLEYDHPGMANRIAAIEQAMKAAEQK